MTDSFACAQEFQAAVGRSYGPSGWLVIEQARINAFADATDDHQWIHMDAARAGSQVRARAEILAAGEVDGAPCR